MKRFIKKFRYGEKGFTLIELLVVIAILGVLAAVAIPNVGKFLGKGHKEAAATELHNVQTATMAAMADANTGTIATPGVFGDDNQDGNNLTTVPPGTAGVDVTVRAASVTPPITAITVGEFIVGGANKVQGSYTIAADGTVIQVAYPGTP